jgi:hypothetical protein
MNFISRRIFVGTTLLVFAGVVLTSVGVSFAAPKSPSRRTQVLSPQLIGVLTTQGNNPIKINGASVKSGGSVPSGALIETPGGVGATLRIPNLGSICISPNSTLNIQFDSAGGIAITLIQGCVILRTFAGTAGRISTPKGTAGQIDPANGGSLDVCTAPSGGSTVGQGAAAVAGAGASPLDCNAAAGAAAVPTFPTIAKWGLIGGIAEIALAPLLFRGGNPSPIVP